MSVTHVAGPVVIHEARAIQRCAICGVILCDNKNKHSTDGTFSTWKEAALVEIDGNRTSDIGRYFNDPIPKNLCIHTMKD